MAFTLIISCLLGLSTSHSVYKRSYPSPKGYHHGKSAEYFHHIRSQPADSLKDRFLEQYNKMMNKSSGYFSADGVPYHSVETLMVEAPDYGHETTSEAYSEYIWLTAMNIWASGGKMDDFNTAWAGLDKYIIPGPEDQPNNDNNAYPPDKPAEYAPEMDSPSDYPVQLTTGVAVGHDPIADELGSVYGKNTFYASHWLLDVDNIYGFGQHEDGVSKNVFINTYQRGPNESVWRTIPQPDYEDFKYGEKTQQGGGCGFLDLFDKDPSGCKQQWKYTGAPDADARTLQATYWAYNFSKASLDSTLMQNAIKLSDYIRYASFDKYFKTIPCYDPNCPGATGMASNTYLLNWYFAWGGAMGDSNSGSWSWRIGASHAHQGYQNVMTAWIASQVSAFESKTSTGKTHWDKIRQTTLDLWEWCQSATGPIAGGITNSVGGRYLNPNTRGITGFFKEMSYQWEPVYHDPPSNNWFGMNAWSQERNAEYYFLTGDPQSKKILDKWWAWIKSINSSILLANNDFQVPSNFKWTGQPLNWTGSGDIPIQSQLTVKIVDWAKDVGTASTLAHTLTYYAAASGDSDAQMMARELLDRLYMYADDIGIGINETRQDYIGNEYGQGFWEPVYVPSDYHGTYPNGDVIKSGIVFLDIRSWYKNDPWWPYIESCKQSGKAPNLIYHRTWAQTEYAIALGDYARLFGATSEYYVGWDKDTYNKN
eukprot:397293_1